MVKNSLIAISFLLIFCSLQGQNVGIGTVTPNAKAMLDITSSDKGILIPRLNTTGMNSITTPPNGLMVYNTDSLSFAYHNGSAWVYLKGSSNGANLWNTKGNNNINENTNFLGTTNASALPFRVNNVAFGELNPSTKNVAFGEEVLLSNASGSRNVALGINAIKNNTFGHDNIAIGSYSFMSNNTGIKNISIGHKSMQNISANTSHNIGIGNAALYNNTKSEIIAIGDSSLYQNGVGGTSSHGIFNTALGNRTLLSNTLGSYNTAVGHWALKSNSSGSNNTSLGNNSGRNNTSGINNTSIGSNSFFINSSGNDNIAIGFNAAYSNQSGDDNIVAGNFALYTNWAGNRNIALGTSALRQTSLGNNNIAVGFEALRNNVTGNSNLAIGYKALYNNTGQHNNVAIGDSALYQNGVSATISLHSINNTAVGSKALASNTTGSNNAAFGFQALKSSTTSSSNAAFGYLSLTDNISGANNSGFGASALANNTSGADNTGIGTGALINNTQGDENTAVGSYALSGTTTSDKNTAIGYSSQSFSDITSGRNTSLGHLAMTNSFGFDNVAIGHNTMSLVYGNNNIAIGNYAGNNSINGNGNIFLGTQASSGNDLANNSIAIGNNAYITQSNSITLGSINGLNGATSDAMVGIGLTTPDEKLVIGKGRLKFRGNKTDNSYHGITWTNNLGNIEKSFMGMETDDFLMIANADGPIMRFHNTSGEVGINKFPLTSSNDSKLQIKQTGVQNALGLEATNTTNHWDFFISSSMSLYYNGAQKGVFDSNSGTYTPVSDRRYKKDIDAMETSVDGLLQLVPYSYRYIDNDSNSVKSVGFMAQDVQAFFPEAVVVNTDKQGSEFLTLNYQHLFVLSVKALQEQQKKIQQLTDEMAQIKAMIQEINKR